MFGLEIKLIVEIILGAISFVLISMYIASK